MLLTSKPFLLAGCILTVAGGSAFGWAVAGTAWQSKLPQTIVNSYTESKPAGAVDRPLIPAAVTPPAPKVEEPAPVKAPETADAPEKKEPKAKAEPKKRKAAAEPGETPRKARPAEIDRGTVESFARRYGITLD